MRSKHKHKQDASHQHEAQVCAIDEPKARKRYRSDEYRNQQVAIEITLRDPIGKNDQKDHKDSEDQAQDNVGGKEDGQK
jgi:hypothetical protein